MHLILTADDFGRSSEINAAVLAAHQHGVLTTASLMVAGDAFDEAVAIARRTPTLAVGLHLVLVDGKAVLPAGRLSLLVGADGRFADAPGRLGVRYFFDPRARRQMAAEVEAQFERFLQTGLPLDHVNGHQHLHMHPAVFPLIVSLARRYQAGGVRIVRDDLRFALRHDPRHRFRKAQWAMAFGLLSRRCRRVARKSGVATVQRAYGLMQTGNMNEAYTVALLQHLQGESAEIYFHPTAGARTDELGPNPQELATLLSPAVRDAIAARKMRLGSYRNLAEGDR